MSTYSRRERLENQSRRGRRRKTEESRKIERPAEPKPVWKPQPAADQQAPLSVKPPVGQLILASLVLAFFSVANPLFIDFADGIQSQFLYAGKAMLAGQLPYMNFFGTEGLLYYFIGLLGSLFNTTWLLALCQAAALYWAGDRFYRLSARLSGSEAVSQRLIWIFYLLIGVLGFGGLYATLFALPFLLNGLWILLRYFSGPIKDEVFIWYGSNAAFVFLIDPKSALLWVAAAFVLLVYNIRRQRKARGFYQALGTFFGFSLVVYVVGYYGALNGSIIAAVNQTFFYVIKELSFAYADSLGNLLYGLLYLIGTGLIMSLIYGLLTVIHGRHREFKLLIYLLFLLHFVESLAAPSFSASHLIILIPFGLLLTGAYMGEGADPGESKSYFILNGFLPLLAVVYLVAYPAWQAFTQGEEMSERQAIAAYIRDNSTEKTPIYAWDSKALIYLKSQRWSVSPLITPDLAQGSSQDDLTFALSHNKANFIAVHNSEKVLDGVASHLADSYTPVDLGLQHFTLYQLK